jgi:hypothetical protein
MLGLCHIVNLRKCFKQDDTFVFIGNLLPILNITLLHMCAGVLNTPAHVCRSNILSYYGCFMGKSAVRKT